MELLETYFELLPRPLSASTVRRFLEVTIGEYGWVVPARYGRLSTDNRVSAADPVAELLEFYEREGQLVTKGRGGDLMISTPRGQPGGYLVWFTNAASAVKASWLARHRSQMVTVAKLIESPLAYAGLQRVHSSKLLREIALEQGSQAVPRLRGYQEGLLGLYWRNVLGPPFSSLIRDRLEALKDGGDVADLGGGYWFLQSYDWPTDALSDDGRLRERQLIEQLGDDLFYDMVNERPPTRRPRL